MISKIHYCTTCYGLLSKAGELAVSLYESICRHYAECGTALEIGEADSYLIQAIKFLEYKGYILTTEIENSAILAVPYVMKSQDSLVFHSKGIEKERP